MKKAFTLIELLVVVAIVAILLAIVLPFINPPKPIEQRIEYVGSKDGMDVYRVYDYGRWHLITKPSRE